MKTLLIFSLLVYSNCFSQFSRKYEKASVTLNTGELVNSSARIYDDLELKNDKNQKSKIKLVDINSVTFYVQKHKNEKIDTLTLHSFKINSKKYMLGFKLFESDKITIYGVLLPNYGGGGSFNGGSFATGNLSNFNYGGNSGNLDEYYCLFKESNVIKEIFYTHSLRSFKSMAAQCFKSCPEIVTKINDKQFTQENISELGEFYTFNCN